MADYSRFDHIRRHHSAPWVAQILLVISFFLIGTAITFMLVFDQ
jgi:hypothetical protein